METQSADRVWPNLAKRIERLERQNRIFKLISSLGVILLSSVLLMGQSRRSNTLTAEQFELVDRGGKTMGVLGMTDFGPAFRLYDKSGKVRAGLLVGDKGPALLLADADEKLRLSLRVVSKGPALELDDAGGKTRVSLDAEEGGPGLSIMGSKGKIGMALGLDDKDNPDILLFDSQSILRTDLTAGDPFKRGKVLPGLYLNDPSGRTRVFLNLAEAGDPFFALADPSGHIRTSLSLTDKGDPVFALADPGQHIRASLMLLSGGNPNFVLSDADGRPLFSKP